MNSYLTVRDLRREIVGIHIELRPLVRKDIKATPSEKARRHILQERSKELTKQVLEAEITYIKEKHSPMKSDLYKEFKEKEEGFKTLVSMERLKYLRKELADVITDLANIK